MSVTEAEAVYGCRPDLLVRDLGTSARFYSHVPVTRQAGLHTTRLDLDVHTRRQIDDLFGERAAAGADIAEPPSVRPLGRYEIRLHDPDGHVLPVSARPE